MKKSIAFSLLLIFPVFQSCIEAQSADKPARIILPSPQTSGGMSLMDALKKRSSSRIFSSKELPLQVLSNLLWAARGVNRKDSGMLTSPSAHNRQEIDVYVVLQQGVFRYEPVKHQLKPILAKDLRAQTGRQGFVAKTPLNLVYVADYSRMGVATSSEDKKIYAAAGTGFISQNVYLFCASQGLATVVRGWVDKKVLAKAMKLNDKQSVILCQTVGYPGN